MLSLVLHAGILWLILTALAGGGHERDGRAGIPGGGAPGPAINVSLLGRNSGTPGREDAAEVMPASPDPTTISASEADVNRSEASPPDKPAAGVEPAPAPGAAIIASPETEKPLDIQVRTRIGEKPTEQPQSGPAAKPPVRAAKKPPHPAAAPPSPRNTGQAASGGHLLGDAAGRADGTAPDGTGLQGSGAGGGSPGTGTGGGAPGFSAGLPTVPPVIVRQVEPPYPGAARKRGVEGSVQVRFLVDSDGRVRDIQIIRDEPKGVFRRTVLDTLPGWRFKPGVRQGRPVDTWVTTTIWFRLDS